MQPLPLRYAVRVVCAALMAALLPLVSTASASPVQELRLQKVGEVTYFHVRLQTPRDMMSDVERAGDSLFAAPAPALAPRLIAADGGLRLVCSRVDRNPRNPGNVREAPAETPSIKQEGSRSVPRTPVPVEGLEFVGRVEGKGEVKAKLIYAVAGRRPRVIGRFLRTPPAPVWKEIDVVLDFGKAKHVAVPREAAERKAKKHADPNELINPPVRDDLQGLWAVAQVDQFNELDGEVTDFGFYGFAAVATARKYGVPAPLNSPSQMRHPFAPPSVPPEPGGALMDTRLYETTTGAAAITESLQLRRMAAAPARNDKRPRIPIGKVQGIDVAEHPWEKMIGDKKPAPEPFAGLIPHDNYYVHFKSLARFLEFSELLDQWGTNVTRAYEVTSRDHRLKARYEQQLCLRSTVLGKTLGPLVIKGIAITGNDAYVREGSDVALLFQVVNRQVFLAAVEPFVAEARKRFGDTLKEGKEDYHGIMIESFVTPLREVSLHRATVDDFVVYANSPAGLRRVLDAAQGRGKRLADARDFQYMRTVFRYDDPEEDGFAFLSDPFIRNLVGPAGKIKERRRLEALASLHMLTHGALFTAWETGKAPVSQPNILQVAGLKVEELPMPDDKPALWDPERLVAYSGEYNTLHFATPLIELPIHDVSATEADEYNRFRLEYLGLWRQYFDPIGMRVSLRDGKVKLDTYILPLIENSAYNQVRRITGKGTVRLDPAAISGRTLFQYMMHLSTEANERGGWFGPGTGSDELGLWMMLAWAADPIGEWFLVRVDDSPNYEKLAKLAERSDRDESVDVEEVARLVWTLPLAIGFDVKNPLVLAAALGSVRTSVMMALPGALTWGPAEKDYKGVQIVRVQATPSGRQMVGSLVGKARRPGGREPFLPAVYYAMIDGGFYLTLNEEMLHQLIDGAVAKREGKAATVEVNTSLYLSPGAADQSRGLLKRLLEKQTHQQARTALPIWYVLYRTGSVAEDATAEEARSAAYRYLGFVPVSPDGAAFRYDRKYDEVVNERHGSFRKPVLQKTTADDSPLNRLLDQIHSIRADLRFREDGIHTVVTLDRMKHEK